MNTGRSSILELVQQQTKQVLQIQEQLSKELVLVLVVALPILTKVVVLDMVDMVRVVIQVAVVDMMVQVLDKAVTLKFIILTQLVIHRDSVVVEDLVVMAQ